MAPMSQHHHELCHHALQLLGVRHSRHRTKSCFLALVHKDHENRIGENTGHQTFTTVALKLELGVLLETRDTPLHIVTAVRSTPGAKARLQDVDRTHQHDLELSTASPRKGTGVLWVLPV